MGKGLCFQSADMDTCDATCTIGQLPLHGTESCSALHTLSKVPHASAYGTHAFRRGHARVREPGLLLPIAACPFALAQDLWQSGSPLAEILRAGQWRSASFAKYLNMADVEKARLTRCLSPSFAQHMLSGSGA